MKRTLCTLAAGLALILAGQSLAADSPEAAVKYRQAVMKALGGHFGAVAAVVKGQVSHGPHVANHARAIKDVSLTVQDIFPSNSTYDDYKETKALPAIWKEQAKFKQTVEDFQAAAAKFAEVAANGDSAAIASEFGALGKTCGGCHKPFRYKE